MNSIFNRVSVRKYLDKDVEDEKIELILKAAMAAPSAGNQQPWEFYVVKNKEIIEKLSQCSPYSSCLKNAPLAIVPVYKTEGLRFEEYAQIDMSICCENILLEATELGLGSVWLGIAPIKERMEKVDEILNLPGTLTSFALIAVGYSDVHIQQQDRFEEKRIHTIK
jgi:nitroreductase